MSASPWAGLIQRTRTPAAQLAPKSPSEKTRLGRVRELIRARGPLSARQITAELELPSTSLVGALMAHEIRRGRVEFRDGRYHYIHEFDEMLAEELACAAETLRRHGYEVKKGNA